MSAMPATAQSARRRTNRSSAPLRRFIKSRVSRVLLLLLETSSLRVEPFTFTIRDVEAATPRAKLVRVAVDHGFLSALRQAGRAGPPGIAERRPFSIASAPEDAKRSGVIDLLVGTPDDGGTQDPEKTDWIFTPSPGDRVDVEGPVGSFTFPAAPSESRFAFIAGGTGIAPLRAMLRHALGIPHDRIALFYSARTADEFAFEAEFRALADAGAIEFRQTVTREGGGRWTGARGRVTADALRDLLVDVETLCFVCGPASMVAEVPTLLAGLGIGPERIRGEES